LVDAQIDDRQRELFRVTFDRLDVPRDRFLVAGDAWRACRNGADPMTFGVAGTEMWGPVPQLAHNLKRRFAHVGQSHRAAEAWITS
jgi:hypothetical protein